MVDPDCFHRLEGMPPGMPAVDQSIAHRPGALVEVGLQAFGPDVESRIPDQAWAGEYCGWQNSIKTRNSHGFLRMFASKVKTRCKGTKAS